MRIAHVTATFPSHYTGRGMGERGRDKVEEKYAWPKIIPRLVQVYEEALIG